MLNHTDVEAGRLAQPSPFLAIDHAAWLTEFFELFPPFVCGDTQANTFCSCKAVLLTVALIGSFNYPAIAALTGLPAAFIATCSYLMKGSGVVSSTEFGSLQEAVRANQAGLLDVEEWLHEAVFLFWMSDWDSDLQYLLTHCRAGFIFGGRTLDAFILDLPRDGDD
jgi:hypothetical protein